MRLAVPLGSRVEKAHCARRAQKGKSDQCRCRCCRGYTLARTVGDCARTTWSTIAEEEEEEE